ncbi:hypothetical protein [Leptolyngbya sp. 'hensonii']|uniref:hypothetical protein n=1 Tax=Leptolyngbya sp. 'hensonii' TaxID=1922337 RepID=UPI00209AC165|nr:hypothetical protein [Leptolyngbya sp. 'hensonii']
MRRRINQALRSRPSLAPSEWYEYFWRQRGVSRDVAALIYTRMEHYSGLNFSRVVPGDRLEEDLKISLVSWFDWHLSLCDDFQQKFGVDLSECFDLHALKTVEELMLFLDRQLLPINH